MKNRGEVWNVDCGVFSLYPLSTIHTPKGLLSATQFELPRKRRLFALPNRVSLFNKCGHAFAHIVGCEEQGKESAFKFHIFVQVC
jgi:hypothetical protein